MPTERLPAPIFRLALADSNLEPNSKATTAARLVLVDGVQASAAARAVGVSRQAVSVAVQRLRALATDAAHSCPRCGAGAR